VQQDDVPPFPDEVAFAIIEQQLAKPLGELFSSISERPVAAASLGQVCAVGPEGAGFSFGFGGRCLFCFSGFLFASVSAAAAGVV